MQAIVQRRFGGPEVLGLEPTPDPEPGPGQVRVAVEAAGVHLIDTQIRAGRPGPFPPPRLPTVPGREVAGRVDAVGPDVDLRWLSQRVVAHLGPAGGGYAERAVADLDALHPLPEAIAMADGVAMVGTGRTALAILEVAQLHADDGVVITAAAGGIGALLVQAAGQAGATVVGLAGGPDKVEVVRDLGADVAVDYRQDDWSERVRAELAGRSVTVALDGVGGPVADQVLDLVVPGGRMVLFGLASGRPLALSAGDLFRTGVTFSAAIGARLASLPPEHLRALADRALAEVAAGGLTPRINPPYRLAEAARAHADLEGRRTTGKVVLVP